MPDLILVDGGKGQLSAAVAVLKKMNVEGQPVVGLAKRLEEVFIPGAGDAQNIPKSSAGLRLLQRVRDEAHRFAVAYHRTLRKKRAVHSELDDIPGIGEKRRKALLRHFGSVKNMRQASLESITSVNGMNRKAAEGVAAFFRKSAQ
jgi:excinuclease ABC subunit C